jgi:hypothetical protein
MKSTPLNHHNHITQQDLDTYPWLKNYCPRFHLHTWTDLAIFLDIACMGTFRQSLDEARRKLAAAKEEKEAVEKRIADLEGAIKSLASLCDAEVAESSQSSKPLASEDSFSSAIGFALKTAKGDLTPVEVRDKMEVLGYDFTKYETDPLSSIHTVLKRLEKRGIVKSRRWPHNRTTYRWIGEGQTEKAGEDAASTNDSRK